MRRNVTTAGASARIIRHKREARGDTGTQRTRPVHISHCAMPCATSIWRPSITSHPASIAACWIGVRCSPFRVYDASKTTGCNLQPTCSQHIVAIISSETMGSKRCTSTNYFISNTRQQVLLEQTLGEVDARCDRNRGDYCCQFSPLSCC